MVSRNALRKLFTNLLQEEIYVSLLCLCPHNSVKNMINVVSTFYVSRRLLQNLENKVSVELMFCASRRDESFDSKTTRSRRDVHVDRIEGTDMVSMRH
jgi:hypothetical protein